MIKITGTTNLKKILNPFRMIDFQIIKNTRNQIVFSHHYFAKPSQRKISPTKKIWMSNILLVKLNNFIQLKK